ncbi:uncharacterized protein LOC110359133 isoform X2 [Columba livia]|uniref:uncharacterized protein LOC110359133 isoform X2 n=1 Tax=Columba livia TaxID=8932 RepID=UPI0031BAC795
MELEEAVLKGQKRSKARTGRYPGKQPGFAGSRARGHRDHGHSQQHSVGTQGSGGSRDSDTSPDALLAGSRTAELEGHGARCPRGVTSPVPWEKRCWGLAQLLDPQPSPGDRSTSSSICTEDFATRFLEGMEEPLWFSEEEDEPTGDVPTEGDDPGKDESLFPAGRRLDDRRRLVVEQGRHPWQGRSPLARRQSLESLGGRISRLSRSDAQGMGRGGARAAPSAPPALGCEHSPHRSSGCRKDPSTITLRGDNPAAGCPWRAPGTSAGRSSAMAQGGSANGRLPGSSGARTRGHPASRTLGLRWQQLPALWGRRGGDITLAGCDTRKAGAGSRQRRAPCSAHLIPLGQRRTGTDVSPCPGAAAQSWRQGGKQKATLPCTRAAGQPLSLRWSLQRSREGTREMGPGVKETRSKGDRARAGVAPLTHSQDKDTCHRDPTDTERMSRQRACADCQEGLEEERRKTSALQEEKLELQKLRELEHRTRSLLRQRQRALDQLHVLLQKERVDALRQLREALDQERAGGSTRLQRLQHLLSHPWEPVMLGQAGGSLAMGTSSVCPHRHHALPDSAVGQGPLAAAVSSSPLSPSHALRVLRGLQERIQHHLGELRRAGGAQGPTSQREKGSAQGQQQDQLCVGKAAALGVLKKQLRKSQSKHPHLHPSSLSMGTGHGSLGLLHHLQHCVQELQLEKTPHPGSMGNLTASGGEEGTTAREEVQGQPGTRDSPSATALPKRLIQSKEEVQSSTTEHIKESSAPWE